MGVGWYQRVYFQPLADVFRPAYRIYKAAVFFFSLFASSYLGVNVQMLYVFAFRVFMAGFRVARRKDAFPFDHFWRWHLQAAFIGK